MSARSTLIAVQHTDSRGVSYSTNRLHVITRPTGTKLVAESGCYDFATIEEATASMVERAQLRRLVGPRSPGPSAAAPPRAARPTTVAEIEGMLEGENLNMGELLLVHVPSVQEGSAPSPTTACRLGQTPECNNADHWGGTSRIEET